MAEGHFHTRAPSRLQREDRVRELRPAELLKTYGHLQKGMTCLDLGCGTGLFSLEMAKIAGDNGLVLAIDDSQKMLDYFKKGNPPANIGLVKGDVRHTPVKSGVGDFCLMALILHEITEHKELIMEANRLLKPGGEIIIVEWKANLRSPGPPKNRRIAIDYLRELLSDNSQFVEFMHEDWSYHHYVVTAAKNRE
jgi:ubiquinone/menaquinone biosynthesis C-methylase UbiE